MQSFLAYRRFERRLRQQIERHGEAAVSGVKSSTPGAPAKDNTDPACEPKDLESGLPPNSEARDRALEEKEQEKGKEETEVGGRTGPIKSRPDGTQHRDTATSQEELSGSTTRDTSSISSDEDEPRHTLSAVTTQQTLGTRLGTALTGVNVRSRNTQEGGHDKGKVFVVGFVDEKDPMNPHNWSKVKRMAVTILVASVGLIVGFASSVDSAAITQARKEFGVSEVTESLATGIYLVGFG